MNDMNDDSSDSVIVKARSRAGDREQRVLAAARALGYIPNAHARKLRLGRSGMIGLALRPRSVRERGADVA